MRRERGGIHTCIEPAGQRFILAEWEACRERRGSTRASILSPGDSSSTSGGASGAKWIHMCADLAAPRFVLSEGCANPRVYPCVVLAARRFVLDGAPEWGVTPVYQSRDSSSTSGGMTMRGMTPQGGLHSSGESKVLHHRQGWKGLELAPLSRSRLW